MPMARKNKSGGCRGDQFNDVEERPYRVGRPLTKTQFKPGISLNPKGRNKKAPRVSGEIEQVLDAHVEPPFSATAAKTPLARRMRRSPTHR